MADNVLLYREICKIKDYLESHPEQSSKALKTALEKVKSLWPILERRAR